MSHVSIEDRVAALERELAQLKKQVAGDKAPSEGTGAAGLVNWIDSMAGSMQDFPEFDEVIRLGREFRAADRPADDDAADGGRPEEARP